MSPVQYGFLFLAALTAGSLNAVAGGGSFFSFPTLMFVGVAPISANATNTIALWPGALAGIGAYRDKIVQELKRLIPLGLVSLIGGGAGALLLLNTTDAAFEALVPFLLLLATVIFGSSPYINRWLRSRQGPGLALWLILPVQFIIAVYGGFFGGGIGIMMLALLAVSGMEDVNHMNSVKLALNAMINGVAVILFIVAGRVNWPAAVVMIGGAILGGYGGARVAQRVEQRWLRLFVILVGSALTVYFLVHPLLSP